VTWSTLELVLEIEERILVDGLDLDGPGLIAAEYGATNQEPDGDDAEHDQDDITVELHLIVRNIFLVKCVKESTLVSL